LYLNENEWSSSDGGELRIYGNEKIPWEKEIDIPPIPGTLVLFKSTDFQHEVLLTTAVRKAVIGLTRSSFG